MSKRWIRSIDSFVTSRIGKNGRTAFLIGSTTVGILVVFDLKFAEIVRAGQNPAGVKDVYRLWWLRLIFGRSRSRMWGSVMNRPIPITLRVPLYTLFSRLYGCNLNEIRYPIESYRCLGHFFARTLEASARPIEDVSPDSMLSPCDAEIVFVGDVEGDRIEQIKGTTYSLSAFLGIDPIEIAKKRLKYCVLYLSPGDYHHFHSPCEFDMRIRRHFSGELFSVSKKFLRFINDVFSVNERVVLSGQWSHGVLHLGAVAAYNVGNIRLSTEPDFRSNAYRTQLWYLGGDIDVCTNVAREAPTKSTPVGQHIGEFRLGSSIVLVFEAPDDFNWDVSVGAKVKVGQRLGGTSVRTIPENPQFAYYAIES